MDEGHDAVLAAAGMGLLGCEDEESVFRLMGEFFSRELPSVITVLSQATLDQAGFVTHEVTGIDPGLRKAAEKVLGFSLRGYASRMGERFRELHLPNTVLRVEGGLADIVAGELPGQVVRAIEKLVGIRSTYSMGMMDGEAVLGSVVILSREKDARLPAHLIESFLYQCSLALARQRGMRLVEESERRLESIFRAAPTGIGLVSNRVILEVNNALCTMTGYSREELVGRNTRLLYPTQEDFDYVGSEKYRQIAEKGTGAVETRWLCKDNSVIDVILSSTPLDAGDMARGVTFTAVDITASKAATAELKEHRRHLEELVAERTAGLAEANAELEVALIDLARVNRELEEASAAKSRFLANMSHELRTPLNSVIGFSGVLLQGLAGELEEEQRKQIEMINVSGIHLLGLINDVLDLAKIEAGHTVFEAHAFDGVALAQEVVDVMRSLAVEKGLELSFEPDEPHVEVRSDEGKVRQVLLNLVGNALKFTDAGSVVVRVGEACRGAACADAACADAACAGEAGAADDLVAFSVADSGPGIPAERLESIFDAFFQLDVGGEAKPKGTGLGLAISTEYARLLRGALCVTSEVGAGSTFTLTIPGRVPSR